MKRTCLIAAAFMLFASLAAAQMSQSSPEVPTASDEAAPSCPLPEGEKVDFSILASACRIELDFCSDCVCGIYRTFWSAHKASGAAWDPNDPSSLGPLLSKMVGTNRACMRQYRSEVAPAMGPNFSRRTQIQDCPWMASPAVPAPECYQRQLYTLATANFTQSNTTGNSLQVVLEQTDNRESINGTSTSATAATPGNSSVSPDPQSLTASTQTSPVAPPGSASSSSDVISYSSTVWMIINAGGLLLMLL